MDPNANLAEQEAILTSRYYPMISRADRDRLRELRTALNDWLFAGGFDPDWSKYPTASARFQRD